MWGGQGGGSSLGDPPTPSPQGGGRIGDRVGGRAGGGDGDRHLAGEPGEVVLHGLELGDRALEGDALVGVGDGEIEDRLQRARHLHGARGGAHQQQGLLVEAGRRVLDRQRARAVEASRR